MLFTVLDVRSSIPSGAGPHAFLIRDNWNDWFEWYTMLSLVVVDTDGVQRHAGSVKIGHFGMAPGTVPLPSDFEELSDEYFSLGQDEDYYQTLYKFEASLRQRIFKGLRDVAIDLDLFDRAKSETVMQRSLLRGITEERVRGRFNRLAKGDAKLTRFSFEYHFPAKEDIEAPRLSFDVMPDSHPPTNIHVIIGRNGVGKTRCLHQMSLALMSGSTENLSDLGVLNSLGHGSLLDRLLGISPKPSSEIIFGNLVSVTFSAFDPFEPLKDNDKAEPLAIPYSYIGLKGGNQVPLSRAINALLGRDIQNKARAKTPDELTADFVASVTQCRVGPKRERWRRALEILEGDPLFKEADVTALADTPEGKELAELARILYQRASSGHKIVLLTITRLIETVEEKTLVLLDEPEAHLHPPLLAAFVRALSDLLIQRNGVAIVATHSPVVLQEVPKKCVTILRRSGSVVQADRPEIETFGENVGVLTREIFGLEVIKTGFHSMLTKIVYSSQQTYEEITSKFGGQLGAEARAIIRGMIAERDMQSQQKR